MGSIFDQTKTGIPEMLTPALDKFVSDLKSERAETILNKYSLLFDRKQAGEDEETGKYIPGALYVNYSADVPKAVSPTQAPITDEFAIADSLPSIEQNFKDGQGGRKMQPQFANKSTMDLIISRR